MRPAQTKRKRFARSSHRTLSQSGQWQHLDVWWQSGSLPSEIRAETQCKSLSSGSVQAFKVFSIQLISRNFTKIRPQFSWFRRLGPTSKVTSDGGAKKRSSSRDIVCLFIISSLRCIYYFSFPGSFPRQFSRVADQETALHLAFGGSFIIIL